ncbi:hypothetical protein NHX12_007051 [Muraenolepis orangiensis]|uniref:Uncharacterized protein n=1 Tax=Muraenolepis orangiensis TaxID=630683 RepID=A0A9Q0DP62_9TELE|nr:hypothetical protein NHX12_007051 [Muraenolepis orangiensis]
MNHTKCSTSLQKPRSKSRIIKCVYVVGFMVSEAMLYMLHACVCVCVCVICQLNIHRDIDYALETFHTSKDLFVNKDHIWTLKSWTT